MRRTDNLTTFMCQLSWNMGDSKSWNPLGLSRPVMGLHFNYIYGGYFYEAGSHLAGQEVFLYPMIYRSTTWLVTLLRRFSSPPFFVLLTVHTGMILVINQHDTQFFIYVYFYSLHVSDSHVPTVRRIVVSIRHLVYVTLCRWRLVCRSTCSCIPDGHLHRVT